MSEMTSAGRSLRASANACLPAVGGLQSRMALMAENRGDRLADGTVIVDEQNRGHGGCLSWTICLAGERWREA